MQGRLFRGLVLIHKLIFLFLFLSQLPEHACSFGQHGASLLVRRLGARHEVNRTSVISSDQTRSNPPTSKQICSEMHDPVLSN